MCVLSWLLCYLVCNSLYECARWLLCNGLCSLNMHVGAVVCHVWICVFAAEVLEDTLNLVHKRTPRDTLHLVHTPHTLHIGWWSGHHMLHITCCTSHVAHCMLHMACCTWPVAHGLLHMACCTWRVGCSREARNQAPHTDQVDPSPRKYSIPH